MSNDLKSFKQELDNCINQSNTIFIIGHNEADFDAIGAAVGINELCRKNNKKSYIILDETLETMEPGVKKVKELVKNQCKFINMEEYKNILDKTISKELKTNYKKLTPKQKEEILKEVKIKNSLLIIVDTNKNYLLANKEYLNNYEKIVIIDHHKLEQGKTVQADYSYINEDASSASEIVTKLIMMNKTKINDRIANSLAAGIYLDTNRFKKNTTATTYDVVEHLMLLGASTEVINKLFLQDFETDRVINHLIFHNGNTEQFIKLLKNNNVTFTLNRESPKTIYRKETIAKAADKLLKYDSTDTSIVMGYIDEDTITVSIRSNGYIDCDKLIKGFCTDETRQGGGNEKSAGAKLYGKDILEEEQNMINYLRNVNTNKIKVKIKK